MGDSLAKDQSDPNEQSSEDIVLIVAAQNDSTDINMVLGSYKNGGNVTRFTLPVYAEKLVELLTSNYEQLKSEAVVSKREITIDKIPFFIIESKIHHKERNYTYWSRFYVAEVGGKEFSFMCTYDNEDDKKWIESSIETSKFAIR
jgi:hypothetical protein